MGKLYCLLGKSSAGKDTVFARLMADESLHLRSVVTYTTRPQRSGEIEGREYHFRPVEAFRKLEASGRMIESRTYHTVFGDWHYFTMDDGQVDFTRGDYLLIGTLESYVALRDYYGAGSVVPIYLAIDDEERLLRLIRREKAQAKPNYREVCRRFLADEEDFTEEKLAELHITPYMNIDLDTCVAEIAERIVDARQK